MPFTLAHPAAVLPLLRTPLVPAALVAGSLAPDVPYFVRVPRSAQAWYEPFVNATTTHAWPGMLLVAVPTAAVLLVLFRLVREPSVDLVGLRASGSWPGAREARPAVVGARRTGAAARAAWLVASLVVGVLTHVAWDSVTHGDGLVVQRVALLQAPALGGMSVARVLQHASTVLGLAVLVWWVARTAARWRAGGGRLVVTSGGRVVLAGIGLVVAVAAAVSARPGLADGVPLENLLTDVVTGAGAAAAIAWIAYAVVWHVIARRAAGVTRRSPGASREAYPPTLIT